MDDVVGVRDGVLGEAAVDRVAGVLLRLAQRLPAADAVVAVSAGVAQPGQGDALADDAVGDARRRADSMMPTPSWPGTNGGVGLTGQSPRAAWMSVWHSPLASIRTRTWSGPGSGNGAVLDLERGTEGRYDGTACRSPPMGSDLLPVGVVIAP